MSVATRIRHLISGHGMQAPSVALSELAARAYFREPVRAVTRAFVRRREPERWIFPVGCYNSGTTITKQLLAAHPDIRTLPKEGVRFTAMFPTPERLGWTRMWAACEAAMTMEPRPDPARYDRIVRDWAPWWGAGGLAFMDKSVSHVTRMPWLDVNFAPAYFIGIVRNGYCAAEGIRRRAFPRGEAARVVGERYPIEMAGRQWVAANEWMARDAAQVRRFRLITYEDLVADPVSVLAELWDFLELRRVSTRRTAGGVDIGGQQVALQNMNAGSIARLGPADVRAMNPVMGGMLAKYGYPILSDAECAP